jgi:hypothetical protein
MLATFPASRDKAGLPALVGIVDGARGAPIGETEGACGGGSAGSDVPVKFCAPSLLGAGTLGWTFGSGDPTPAVAVLGVAAVGVRVLGALVGALGAYAPLDAGVLGAALGLPLGALGALLDAPAPSPGAGLLIGAPPPDAGVGPGFLGRVPPLGGLPPAPVPRPV